MSIWIYTDTKEGQKMKRALSILLALIVTLSLCACGQSEEDVKKELIKNVWSNTEVVEETHEDYWTTTYYVTEYNFSNSGTVSYYYSVDLYFNSWSYNDNENITTEKKTGTYTIEDGEIIISFDDGQDVFLNYTYENEELVLTQETYDGEILYFFPPTGP